MTCMKKNVNFWNLKKTHYRPTNQPTDGPTDRRTDRPSYRDARTHLKILAKTQQSHRCKMISLKLKQIKSDIKNQSTTLQKAVGKNQETLKFRNAEFARLTLIDGSLGEIADEKKPAQTDIADNQSVRFFLSENAELMGLDNLTTSSIVFFFFA